MSPGASAIMTFPLLCLYRLCIRIGSPPSVPTIVAACAALRTSFATSCVTPAEALRSPSADSGHNAKAKWVPKVGMVNAAGVEPLSQRMVFHMPLPNGIMTGTDLALSNSSAHMSTVATCAKTVDAYVSGLDLKASPRSLASRVSSLALWRPYCL